MSSPLTRTCIALLLCGVICTAHAYESVIEVPVDKDAYITGYAVDAQLGSVGELVVEDDTRKGLATDMLLGFNISGLPGWTPLSSHISSATLILRDVRYLWQSAMCQLIVRPTTDDWSESYVAWDNAPAAYDAPVYNLNTSYIYYASTQPVYTLDLTTQVANRVDSNLYDLNFRISAVGACMLYAKESGMSSFALHITYETGGVVYCGGDASSVCEPAFSEQCCADSVDGPSCYNSTTHQCAGNTNQQRVCGKDLALCGSICYNTTSSSCSEDKYLCGYEQSNCGSNMLMCYNASAYVCLQTPEAYVICTIGQQYCAGRCYSPNLYDCVEDDWSNTQRLCPVDHLSCGDACYKSTEYMCVDGLLQDISQ